MLLTAVHRLPGGMDGNKQNCIVCFSSLMDLDEVLQKGIALKPGSGYSVVPDLPPSVSIMNPTSLSIRSLIKITPFLHQFFSKNLFTCHLYLCIIPKVLDKSIFGGCVLILSILTDGGKSGTTL
jgi:hypothetical protein